MLLWVDVGKTHYTIKNGQIFAMQKTHQYIWGGCQGGNRYWGNLGGNGGHWGM